MHSSIAIILSTIAVYVISFDALVSKADYLSVIGSVASVYAIIITLWQLRQVKTAALAATEAALKKSVEIDSFITYANIERQLEACGVIASYVSGGQFEAAAIKLDEMRKLLIEMREKENHVEIYVLNKAIGDIGNDSVNLRNHWLYNEDLDVKVILKHINTVSNILSDFSANLKSDRL